MAEQNLSNPTTEEELTKALSKAVNDGNLADVDRLMAVELPEAPVVEEPAEPVEADPAPVNNEDESSEVEDGTKDGAANGADPAAPTPVEPAKEEPKPDDINALKAELHRLKSDAGRVAYLQRRQQELERELREVKLSRKVEEPASTATNDKSPAPIPESVQKRLNALKEIDPDLAETLEEMTKALRQESTATASTLVKEVVDLDAQRAEEQFLQDQYSVLVREVPYAPQVFASPEWRQWKETLSPARRAFAESIYADEVKVALGAFVNEMQARAQTQGNSQQVPATPSAPTSEGGDPTNVQGTAEATSKVQEARNRKLAATPTTHSSVAAKGGSVVVDEAKQFAEFYKQIQKDNHLG